MKPLFILLISLLLFSCDMYTYTVEIDYCDDRKSDTVTYQSHVDPYISTYKEGAPVVYANGRKYVNVCELNILDIKYPKK